MKKICINFAVYNSFLFLSYNPFLGEKILYKVKKITECCSGAGFLNHRQAV